MDSSLQRLRERIAALSTAYVTTHALVSRTDELVRRAVPASASVWATVDPATWLFTSCQRFGLDGVPDRERVVFENELDGDDFNLFSELARASCHAGALSIATGNDLRRSKRYQILEPDIRFVDELRMALVARGHCWGTATFYRRPGEREFTKSDVAFCDTIASEVGEALRLSMVRALAEHSPPTGRGPGVVILDASGALELSTGAAQNMLLRLRPEGGIPPAVAAVAVGSTRSPSAAHVRVIDTDGSWLELHGSPLEDGRVAVVIEEAHSPALATIIVDACGLTAREREVTELVLRGVSTREMARSLVVSEYTVQDHLKSVFDKTGVRSRRELAALLSDRYYRGPRDRGASPGPYGWFAHVPARSSV